MKKYLLLCFIVSLVVNCFAQTITSFSPASAKPGTTVTITGTNLAGTSGVSFGGVTALGIKVVNGTTVTAVVPVTASGDVSVKSVGGNTATLGGFTYIPSDVPVIVSADMSGTLGTNIFMLGVNLRTATAVTFGGIPALKFAPYELGPDNTLVATVGPGASGDIVVTNPSGTTTFPGFIYTASTKPYITSVVPSSGPPGTTITINGYNLGGVSSVTVGQVAALSFTVNSPTSITAVVGPGYDNIISFSGPGGNAVDGNSRFTITTPSAPTITSFTPASAAPGTTVTITGTNLAGTTGVSFGGVTALGIKVVNGTTVTAVVPVTASGDVSVKSVGGNTATLGGFTYIPSDVPVIVSADMSGTLGTNIFMLGVNLRTATAVTFGGIPALKFASYELGPDNTLVATVGPGASGDIVVTNPSGTTTFPGFTYTASTKPYITSVVPSSGPPGTTITINGYNLGGVSSLTVGQVAALSFTVNSPTSITAVVGPGYDNTISFSGPGGNAVDGNSRFTITTPSAPTITSFTPASAAPGTTVTITGTNLAGTTGVSFGGVAALNVKVVSTTMVTAIVPVTNSGDVLLTSVGGGTATLGGFVYIPSNLPVITSVGSGSNSGTLGTYLNILGVNLRTATSVTFGGVPALSFEPYGLDPDRALGVIVGLGASGDIVVTTPSGTATFTGFTYTPSTKPYVTSVVPSSGPPGTTITINGYNLGGVSSVTIGEAPALSFSVVSPTSITAVVGPGYDKIISFTGVGGAADGKATFTITTPVAPSITSFSPASATPGTTVNITGTDFSAATSVKFGGVAATSFNVVSPTSITAVVGAGASGDISVTTPGGMATLTGFTYIAVPAPTITSFTPASAATGTTIIITGTNFTGATAISLGGVAATSFTVVSATSITAVAGAGASGNISVTTPGGTATLAGFTYLPIPTISSFTPTSAVTGNTVTITGTNFTGASAINFGGTAASSYTVVSPTSITAIVGAGASGNVSVTNNSGTANKAGFVYVGVPVVMVGGSTEINIGSTVTLSTPANANYAYQWYKDGIAIATGGTANNYAASQSGIYTVAVTAGGVSATSAGINVHSSLPPSNFTITSTSAVCKGAANGTIKVTAVVNLPYTIKIAGVGITTTTYPLTDNFTIPNLPAGTYSLYINIAGYTYEQYFSVKITEPKDLSVYSAVNKNTNNVDLTLDGGDVYLINLNGTNYTTTNANITLPLNKGVNNISVTTDKPCQGLVEKRIIIGDNITAYPNPFENTLNLSLGDKTVATALVQIFNSSGKQLFSRQLVNQSGDVPLDLSTLEHTQVYIMKLTIDNTTYVNKIIRK